MPLPPSLNFVGDFAGDGDRGIVIFDALPELVASVVTCDMAVDQKRKS